MPSYSKPPKSLLRKVGRAIADYRMIREGDRVLLGVSGGKDSLSLLQILAHLQTYAPVKFELGILTVDPEVEGFPVEVAGDTAALEGDVSRHLYLRIVAIRIDPARFQELRKRYDQELVPALLETPGCRAAFLVEGIKARTRALSVTVWDSEEDAVRYELSGRFDELVGKISEFFSGLYQWKLSLSSSGLDRVSGNELEVSGYNIVTGRRL